MSLICSRLRDLFCVRCCGPSRDARELLDQYRHSLPPSLPQTEIVLRIARHWQLRRSELLYFFNYFQSLDADHSGAIDPLEFFLFLNEPRTRVLNYVLPIIANNPKEYEKMTFPSWMLAVFGFCFMTSEELMQHVFQRYDSTGTGRILQNDLYKFMKQMHADNPLFPKDVVIAMSQSLEVAGYFDYETFRGMCQRYPMFFYPITRLQYALRDRVIGAKLFAALDARTQDIYFARHPGDRPRLYYSKKLWREFRMLIYSLCPCTRPRTSRIHAAQEKRELLKREKAAIERRRKGGVNGELFEGRREELQFQRLRAAINAKNGNGDADEMEDDLPSALRRKYFGSEANTNGDASNDPARARQILKQLRDSIDAPAIDEFDSDDDSVEDHFEEAQIDEYEDAVSLR